MALITKVPGLIVDETSNFTFANANVTGNLTSGNANLGNLVTANYVAGTLTTALQPNITQVGELANLTVTGNITAGAVKTNSLLYANGEAYAIGGGITIAGTNSQVQYNSTGSFGASANFTFNTSTNTLSVDKIAADGGLLSNIAAANVSGTVANATYATSAGTATSATTATTAGTVTTNAQPNITSVGTLSGLTVNGNITSVNADLGNAATANYFIGSGANLSNLQASNITGTVANATYATSAGTATSATTAGSATSATTAGTVTTAAQPNITSVGTLSSVSVTGNVTAAYFIGSGNNLSNLQASNVTGTVANATYATSAGTATSATTATTAGTVTTNAQPNITSVGTLSSLAVTGDITSTNANLGNAVTANYFLGSGANLSNIQASNVTGTVANATYATSAGTATSATTATTAGTVTTNAQPNITSIGTLSGLTVNGDIAVTNANLGNAATANFFIGSGNNLSNIQAANITGTVANATYSITAGTANSVAGANVSGAVAYATTANSVAGANVSGEVTFAATANAVAGANVSGQVANALVAGTVYTNAQPNITSVGTLSSVAVTGNVTAGNANLGNLVTANFFSGNGSLLTGITVSAGSSIVSGNSNVSIPSANGNINFSAVGNANILVITGTGANITGTADVTGNLTTSNLTVTNKTNLGSNANITITGGTANYVLQTDGVGNLSWTAQSGGAGGGLTYTAATTPPASGNVAGDQWFNTTANVLYEYIDDGTSLYWVDIQTPTVGAATSTTYVNRSYTGDGSTTTYTVTTGCTVNNILVFLNGICRMPTTDYTVSGTVLTLIPAPTAGTVIQVRELPR